MKRGSSDVTKNMGNEHSEHHRDVTGWRHERSTPTWAPPYRDLTGPDERTFCRRVSEAFDLGFCLNGGPAVTFNGVNVIVAQALTWPGHAPHHAGRDRIVARSGRVAS